MKESSIIISCKEVNKQTKRTTPFNAIYYTLNYESEDRELIDELIERASRLSLRVNPNPANCNGTRTKPRIMANALAGVLSEYLWCTYLNEEHMCVQTTEFVDASTQIDLETVNNHRRIEVRSSFPRNGICFAICHPYYQFDILGPYVTNYKSHEIKKDFYVRALFPIENPVSILERIKEKDFTIYLTGGATWEMMVNDEYSTEKTLMPEDAITAVTNAKYRVVPFSKALDTVQIRELIYKAN